MDPTSLLTAPITAQIWIAIRSNFYLIMHTLMRRKWIIMLAGITGASAALFFTRKTRPQQYKVISFQLVVDSARAELQTLEYKQKSLQYISEVFNTLMQADTSLYRYKQPPQQITATVKDYILEVAASGEMGKMLDSIVNARMDILRQLAKNNLPANTRLEKLAEYTYRKGKKAMILALSTFGAIGYASIIIITLTYTNTWTKIKKTGLPVLGLLHKPYGKTYDDNEILFLIQNLLHNPIRQEREVILFAGSSEMPFLTQMQTLLKPIRKVIHLDFDQSAIPPTMVGFLDYIVKDTPLSSIIWQEEGRETISLGCPDPKIAFYILKNHHRMSQFFDELREYNVVIISCTSLNRSPDALALMPFCNKIVLTHRHDSEIKHFYRHLQLIRHNGFDPAGFLVYDLPDAYPISEKFWR